MHRRKPTVPAARLTDREIFATLPLGDLWDDADLISVYMHLWRDSLTHVPDSWLEVMQDFTASLMSKCPDANLVHELNELLGHGV